MELRCQCGSLLIETLPPGREGNQRDKRVRWTTPMKRKKGIHH